MKFVRVHSLMNHVKYSIIVLLYSIIIAPLCVPVNTTHRYDSLDCPGMSLVLIHIHELPSLMPPSPFIDIMLVMSDSRMCVCHGKLCMVIECTHTFNLDLL